MTWVAAGEAPTVTKARKVVLDVEGHEVLVLAHDGAFYAFANRCIHKQRELAKGVVLNGKLVCPGHQWAFELDSGWEAIKEECQPTYPVRVVDGVVEVDVTAPEPATADPQLTTPVGVDGASVVAVDVARSQDASAPPSAL
jgi:nitrite reductase (NADH) small subunit